jgi:hypothetical protein
MCTLTFIPQKEGFLFTVNRDESPQRAAGEPIVKKFHSHNLWLAPEPISGSSNLVVNTESSRVVVLLNGAFTHHNHQPPYRKSRGVIVLESFDELTLLSMFETYDFQGIEPFTLVMFDKNVLSELRWDGTKAHYAEKDIFVPQLWSSAMMYRGKWQQERERWFHEFLIENPQPTEQELLWFHHNAGAHDSENGLIMNRMNLVRTVSVSQIVIKSNRCSVYLHDLMQLKEYNAEFTLNQSSN